MASPNEEHLARKKWQRDQRMKKKKEEDKKKEQMAKSVITKPKTTLQKLTATGFTPGALASPKVKQATKKAAEPARQKAIQDAEKALANAKDRRSKAAASQKLRDAQLPLTGRDAKLGTAGRDKIQDAKELWHEADRLEKTIGRTSETQAMKRYAHNQAERVRIQHGYTGGTTGEDHESPLLSTEERKLTKVGQENLKQLKLWHDYGKRNHDGEMMQEAARQAEILRQGYTPYSDQAKVSWADLHLPDKDVLQDDIDKAWQSVKDAQMALRNYINTRQGMATFGTNDPTLQRLQENLAKREEAMKVAEKRLEQAEYVEKYGDMNFQETGHKWSDFWNQFKANKAMGRIGQDTAEAYAEYMKDPTSTNLAMAMALSQLEGDFAQRNAEVLDEEGQVLPWLSQSAAGYLPQLWDQTKARVGGGLAGAGAGAVAGSAIPGVGTATGAIWGLRAGFMAGSAKQSYDVIKGQAYRSLIDAGVDHETAMAAANDEAVISSIIEMADAGIDIFTLGIGSFMKSAGKAGLKTAGGSAGKTLLKSLGKYGINVGGEMGQEFTQQGVSYANLHRDDTGLLDLARETWGVTKDAITGENPEAWKEMSGAAKEGGKISAIFGGTGMVTNAAINKGMEKVITSMDRTASDKELGKRVKELGREAVQELVEEAYTSEETAYLASPVATKLQRGETPSDQEVGRLARALQGETQEEPVQESEDILEETARETVQEAQEEVQAAAFAAPREVVAEEQSVAPAAAESVLEGEEDILMQAAREMTAPKTQEVSKVVKSLGYGQHGTQTFERIIENSDMTVDEAKMRFQSAYEAGLTNTPRERVSLLGGIQEQAYNAGRQDYILTLNRAQDGSQYATIRGKDSGLILTDAAKGVEPAMVNDLHKVSKALGIKTMFVEHIENGSEDVVTGGYMTDDGVLVIARDAVNPYIEVAKHEITHRLQKLAPKEYTAFRNLAVEYESRDRGYGNTTLVEEMQDFYAENGVHLTTEGAMDEIAANFAERLFTDEKARKAMAEQAAGDKQTRTTMEKFWQTVREFIQKVKRVFKGDKAKMDQAAQEQYGATIAELEEAERLWKEAYRAAAENVKKAEGQAEGKAAASIKRDGKLFRETDGDTTVLTTSVGNPVAMMDENGSAQFSLKTYKAFGRAELLRWLKQRVKKGQIAQEDADDLVRQLDEYYELCQKFKDKYAPFGAWSEASVVTDEKGKPAFSVVKKNGEYAMNLDFSLVCKKRRTLDAVFSEMIRRGVMDKVSMEEVDIAKVNDIIRESGFETACALCFVDSKRYRQGKVADTFVSQYNSMVRLLATGVTDARPHYFDFVETGNYKTDSTGLHTLTDAQLQPGIQELKRVMRENGSATVAHKIAKHLLANPKDRKYVARGDFMNTAGFEAVKVKKPEILKLYNSSKGAGGPKAAFSDVQYLGEILKKNNFTPGRAYAVGGVRIQSFSDYIPRLVFDYLQMVADLAAKKLPAHAYTKEATFVKQFGMTGIKMNMSLVPAIAKDGVAPGLDKNGDYFWFDGQSFGSDVNVKGSGKTGFDLAVQIQNAPGYSQHCGTIAVGVSNQHIEKMLDDPDIRMIIPYHKSSLNHIVAVMNNIDQYKDYTGVQNTRDKDGKKISGKDFNYNEALRRTGDAKTAANEYLAWCEKNDYIPKFDDFAGRENYYKVLEDFSTYDNGVAAPQGPVTMTLPKEGDPFGSMAELIEEGLDEDAVLEGRREKAVPEIVDKVEQVLGKRENLEGVQFSLVKKPETLEFLENQKHVKVYRAMQEIDGKLYPPMAAKVKGENGKKQLVEPTKLGEWYQADENPRLIKFEVKDPGTRKNRNLDAKEREANEDVLFGSVDPDDDVVLRDGNVVKFKELKPFFELDKANDSSVPARYNPYFHSSLSALNDQFSTAYERPNLVVVEGYIPESELTSGYRALYAKDPVGETEWNDGPVAKKLKGDKARKVFLSRWFKAERVLKDEEAAKMIAKVLEGEGLKVPWNVVTPTLYDALLNEGVEFDYRDYKKASKTIAFESTRKQFSMKIDTSNMSEDGKKIVSALKRKKMAAKYGVGGGYASYTWSRMSREIAKSVYRGNQDGAASHIAWIDPLDYIYATTTNQEGRDRLRSEAGALDLDRIRAEDQPIYLHVNMESGEIVGHEGRHRVLALQEAGVENVAVVIYWSGTDNKDMQPIARRRLKGQDFGFGRGEGFSLTNALPLSERYADAARELFSEMEGSIQFSLKAQKDLMKENAKLREVNQGLRQQFKTTKFAKVDKKALDRFTKDLLKDYASGADINEIRQMLDQVYTYIANGETEGTSWTEAQRRAYEAAVAILESAVTLDNQMWEQYGDLRRYLRTTAITLNKAYDHDLVGYENLEEFRRANFGRLKITKDGTPVDVIYRELAVRWPEFFDEYTNLNQADQLLAIADVLDQLQPTEINPYSHNMREAATWLASDILERFFELPQAKPTFADKAQEKLTRQVIKDHKKLERLREQKNEKISKIIEENREKVKTVQTKEKAKRQEAVQKVKEHYKAKEAKGSESRKARELRAKIMRHAKDLNDKLLKPTDKHHVPEDLRKPVAAMLDAINQESQFVIDEATGKRKKGGEGLPTKRTQAFEEMRKQYQAILDDNAPDEGLIVDPAITAMLERVTAMRDTPLHAMTSQELDDLWQALRVVEHMVNNAGKTLAFAKYERTSEWAQAFVDDTDTRKSRRRRNRKRIGLDLENPYTFFSRFGDAGKDLFRMLRNAQDQQQMMVTELEAKVKEIVNGHQVKAWQKETHEFTTDRGDKLTLTTAQVMEVYELTKREQARDHLVKGGIVQPQVESKKIARGTDAILLTENDLGNIVAVLTDEQVQVADGLQKLTTTLLAEWGNAASMKAYGYKKFVGKDYWPIKSAREGIHSKIETGGNNTRSIKNIGLAKNVMPHASNPLDIGGIFKTFAGHAGDMTDYAAWLCPMEDAQRIYNFKFRDDMGQQTGKTIKGLLDTMAGTGGQDYWFNLMEDIQNGLAAKSDTGIGPIINKAIGGARGASVGANLRVIVQQPTAILRATAVLNPADMVAGLAVGGGWKKALEHSAIAKRKDMGGFDISSPAQLNEILFDDKKGLQRFNEAMMWGAGKADAVTWGRIWNACEIATKRQHKDLEKGSDAFYKEVSRLFSEVIDQSQVVDGVLQRSQIMRSSGDMMKAATAFMGEPIMALNMFSRAYDNLVKETDNKKRSAAFRTFGRTAMALLVTNAVNAVAQSLVDAERDDDPEKDYLERLKGQLIGLDGTEESAWDKVKGLTMEGNLGASLNPVLYIPFAKDLISLMEGYDVERADAAVAADIIQAATTLVKSLGDDGKRTIGYAVQDLAKQVGKVFGVSAPNIMRDVWGIVRSVAVETGDFELQYKMEKAIYKMSTASNVSRFTDLLYRAYKDDKDAFDKLYKDMLEEDAFKTVNDDGEETSTAEVIGKKLKKRLMNDLFYLYEHDEGMYKAMYKDLTKRGLLDTGKEGTEDFKSTEDAIASAMETLMKKVEGVDSVDDLDKRYVPPEKQDEYDAMLESVRGSKLWKDASEKQKNNVEGDVYDIVMETKSGVKVTEKLEGGKEYDVDETDYLLYQLALSMVDQPNDSGNLGTYTTAERAEAFDKTNFSSKEKAFLWSLSATSDKAAEEVLNALEEGVNIDTYIAFKEFASTAKSDKDENGKTTMSKKDKIKNWLSENGVRGSTYSYLYYDVMGYKK